MKIRRRTAVRILVLLVVASVAGLGWMYVDEARIRATITAQLQAVVTDGHTVELDTVEYDWDEGLITATGLRLRRGAEPVPLVDVPVLEIRSSLWNLVTRTPARRVKIHNPRIVVERDENGDFPLLRALRVVPGDEASKLKPPALLVTGGEVVYRDRSLFADGEDVHVVLERLALEPDEQGALLTASLVETGSAVHEGSGALGAITVNGRVPLDERGLEIFVHEFEVSDALRVRLAADVRATLDSVAAEGMMRGADGLPGLEFKIARVPGRDRPALSVTARPEDLSVVVDGFPALFTDVNGEVKYADGRLDISYLGLRRGEGEMHVRGRVDDLDDAQTPFNIEFWARDLYLDRGLYDSVPGEVREIWDAYDIGGVIDVTSDTRREDGSWESGSFDSHLRRRSREGPVEAHVDVQAVELEMSYKGYVSRKTGRREGFDYPATNVTGRVIVDYDGKRTSVQLLNVKGFHGETPVAAEGTVVDWGEGEAAVEIHIVAEELPLDDDVREAFPDDRLWQRWSPSGVVKRLHVIIHQDREQDRGRGAWDEEMLEFDGRANFTYDGFPLPLRDLQGRVTVGWSISEGLRIPRTELSGLVAIADGAEVRVDRGTIEGREPDARLNLGITVRGAPLDGALEAALRASEIGRNVSPVWDALRPSGSADISADITGTTANPGYDVRIDFDGTTGIEGWNDMHLPLRGLTGTVLVDADSVVIRDARGWTVDGGAWIDGSITDPGGAVVLDLEVGVDDLALDESLRRNLGRVAENASGFFDTVRPAEGFRGDVVVQLKGPADSLETVLDVSDVRGIVRPLDLRNLDIGDARAHFEKGIVTLNNVVGSMASREFTIGEGRLDVEKGSGRLDVSIRRLRFPRDLAGLIPMETIRTMEEKFPERFFHVPDLVVTLDRQWRRVRLDGTMSLSPIRAGSARGLGLEGVFRLGAVTLVRESDDDETLDLSGTIDIESGILGSDLRFEDLAARLELSGTLGRDRASIVAGVSRLEASLFERPLTDATARMLLEDGVFTLSDLHGLFAKGDIAGTFEVGGERPALQGSLTLRKANARELFSPLDPKSKIKGTVDAEVKFRSRTGEMSRLRGEGRVDVRDGWLADRPTLNKIFDVLSVLQKHRAFTEGFLVFGIEGDHINVEDLLLDSSALALHKGRQDSRIWFDGHLDVALRPDFKLLTDSWLSKLLWPLNQIIRPFYERIHSLRMTGTLSDPQLSNTPFPDLFYTGTDRPRTIAPGPWWKPKPAPPVDF